MSKLWNIFLLGEDMLPFIKWWFAVFCLGIVFMPLSGLLFSNLHDKGYLFSKTVGIAVSGYLMWMLSALKIMKFTTASCIITAGMGLIINIAVYLYLKLRLKKNLSEYILKDNLKIFVAEELMFFAVFLLFSYIRGFNPEAYGTEKFMDYGFMTTMMRSDYMPPQDFWYSGTALNYYYVGQFMATYLTRLSFVEVSCGYNLMLTMTGAFCFVLAFSLAYNLMIKYSLYRTRMSNGAAVFSGILAALAVCVAGNMHYPLYRWIIPTIKKLAGEENVNYSYWFPDATRYIGYNPETHDKTIHEFPSYSFVLGDLHAHVINIMFVLTVLAVLMSWLFGQNKRKSDAKIAAGEIFNPSIIVLSFFIGLFHTTNFWDYPIYYVVSGAIILFSNMIMYNFKKKAYLLTALQGILVIVLAKIFALPFSLQFEKISSAICLVDKNTIFYQFMVLWGLPITTIAAFIIISVLNYKENRKYLKGNKKKSKQEAEKGKDPLLAYMEFLSVTDLYVITIGLCAIGLTLMPEIIYVKDIYSGDYKRANTMFKLTYQAFILFGICFGYIFVRLLKYARNKGQRIVAAVLLGIFCLTLPYSVNAVKSWYSNIFDKSGYKGIDATSFLKKDFKDDYPAIEWLNENIEGTPVVLEANGYSYTDYQRVSVMTGLPTVLGWYTHEQLWKSSSNRSDDEVVSEINSRAADIETIYTSGDEELVRELIERYNISYIYVGSLEEQKYGEINHELIKSLGEVVYENPDSGEYDYRTYIVKINRQQ